MKLLSTLVCTLSLAAMLLQAASPVAQFKFNGNYEDATGNGLDGVSAGTWESFGDLDPLADLLHIDPVRGGVYRFTQEELDYDVANGGNPHNNRIELPVASALPNLPADAGITYSLWVKREAVHSTIDSSYDFTFLVYLGAYGNNPIFSISLSQDGRIYAYIEGNGSDQQVLIEGSTAVPAGVWTHVALAIDRQNNLARGYINGVEDTLIYRSGNTNGGVIADISGVGDGELDWARGRIGNNDGTNNGFLGCLDDLRIYYEALPEAEIQDLARDYPVEMDFSTFTVDRWPTYNFSFATWEVSADGSTVSETTNADVSVFYGSEPIVGKVVRGFLTPGGDDDVAGIVLGYEPGDANNTSGEFILIDWKGNTQNFDFVGDPLHANTPGGTMPRGLAISRVTGQASADELWQHTNLLENPNGGVEELARANTLGNADYDDGTYEFEIYYTETQITVYVNGVLEFDLTGTFPASGTFGIYELAQSPGLSASNFTVSRPDTDNGEVELDPITLTPNPPATPSPENPYGLTAYVLETTDSFTQRTGAAELLRRAGFHVIDLPLNAPPYDPAGDPEDDVDLIFFGSFVSESSAYQTYMSQYGDLLDDYIDRAGLLVQMTQADQDEAVPPFLPDTQNAVRSDTDFTEGYVINPGNPLIQGIPTTPGPNPNDLATMTFSYDTSAFWENLFGWETFDLFSGFEVILAGTERAAGPILMEGAYGQGRFILSALASDKILTTQLTEPVTPEQAEFNEKFFANLYEHAKNTSDRTVPPINITPPPGASDLTPGAWTLAVLPDTQIYTQNYPGMFFAQTSWIKQHVRESNIRFVLHLGDIVNVNSLPEWRNAEDAFELIDDVVPYAFVGGNHDYGPGGNAATRDTFMNLFLEYSEYLGQPTFGGSQVPGTMDNTYHFFEAWGHEFIVICLEWGPRDSTIDWAKTILEQYPNKYAILVTHAYMNNNDMRYDITDTVNPQAFNPHFYSTPGGVNDGEELWQKLVRHYNFVLTLNGHVLGDGTGYRVDTNDLGNQVHQMLVNYQFRSLGGEAYMRLLEFQPDGRTVVAKSYSPVLNNFLLTDDQDFSFVMDLGQTDLDGDGTLDYHDEDYDWDGDGLNNKDEFEVYGTSTRRTDTDGDGVSDKDEVEQGTNPTSSESIVYNAVQSNPAAFGLFSEGNVGDFFPGYPIVQQDGGSLNLKLQPEASFDAGATWQPVGDPVEWSLDLPSDTEFVRISGEENP